MEDYRGYQSITIEPSWEGYNLQNSAGFEFECQARSNGDMLGVHSCQGKAEECGAIQPSQEEPGPWRESVSGSAGVAALPRANWRR